MEYLPEPALPLPRHSGRTVGGNAAFHNFNNDYTHIHDPNLRRRLALSDIDKSPFGWYHVRAITVAGIGFFTDSYDLFAINLITSMLGMVFWQGNNNGVIPMNVTTAIKAATSAGAAVGQLGFGWLADKIGRRKMYGVELAIIILSTFAQSIAAPSKSMSMTGLLLFWRVVMGIGIGGDYPESAVITSEFAPTRWRGGMMAAVFAMQGAGQFSASIVALITTAAFRDSFIHTKSFSSCDSVCQLAADRAWRIIVGFGALPACFALYYRITIPETPRYTFDVARDIEKADADIKAYMESKSKGVIDPIAQHKTKNDFGQHLLQPSASWSDVYHYFKQWENGKILIGTSMSWFWLDLALYGLGLNSSLVLTAIGYVSGPTVYDILFNGARGNVVLVCAGSIPGYLLSVFTIDTIGRKPIQVFGFAILTILFATIGFGYNSLSKGSLFALYIIAQFFFNFGPNTTTFIVPGECFPTRYRSTGHGLSAATGKVGAVIAHVVSQPLLAIGASEHCEGKACSPWLGHLMQIFAAFMLCGTLFSLLIPETKGRTLEELAGEPVSSFDSVISGPGDKWWRKYSPFYGGKPAGFSRSWKSPGFLPRSPGMGGRGKRERIGIMTSPALLPKNRNGTPRTGMSMGFGGGGTGGGGAVSGHRSEESGDTNSRTVTAASAESGRDLVWGAGWKVQNHGRRAKADNPGVENVQLMDVGMLLK